MYYNPDIRECSWRLEGVPHLKSTRSFDPYNWISFLTNSLGFDRDIKGREGKRSKEGFLEGFFGGFGWSFGTFFFKKGESRREDRNGVVK